MVHEGGRGVKNLQKTVQMVYGCPGPLIHITLVVKEPLILVTMLLLRNSLDFEAERRCGCVKLFARLALRPLHSLTDITQKKVVSSREASV